MKELCRGSNGKPVVEHGKGYFSSTSYKGCTQLYITRVREWLYLWQESQIWYIFMPIYFLFSLYSLSTIQVNPTFFTTSYYGISNKNKNIIK